jgi:hypothetical protein
MHGIERRTKNEARHDPDSEGTTGGGLADPALDLPHGPADVYALRRLRPRVGWFPMSYTCWRNPPFPRRWREQPRRIRCINLLDPASSQYYTATAWFCRPDASKIASEIPPLGHRPWSALTRPGNCACSGGHCALVTCIAEEAPKSQSFADPLPATRAIGHCGHCDHILRNRDGAAGFRTILAVSPG